MTFPGYFTTVLVGTIAAVATRALIERMVNGKTVPAARPLSKGGLPMMTQTSSAVPAFQLARDERIIWEGRPGSGLLLSGRDFFLIPFSLVWCGFALFWERTALTGRTPVFFRLWGIPFVLMGLFMAGGRFALDAWLRGRTFYAVTNQRILIMRGGPWPSFTALGLDRVPQVQLTQRRDGRGTLRFGPAAPGGFGGGNGFAAWSPALDPTPQFIAIENARDVFERIQNALRGDGGRW